MLAFPQRERKCVIVRKCCAKRGESEMTRGWTNEMKQQKPFQSSGTLLGEEYHITAPFFCCTSLNPSLPVSSMSSLLLALSFSASFSRFAPVVKNHCLQILPLCLLCSFFPPCLSKKATEIRPWVQPDKIRTFLWAEIKLWMTKQTVSPSVPVRRLEADGQFPSDSLNARLSGCLPRFSISALFILSRPAYMLSLASLHIFAVYHCPSLYFSAHNIVFLLPVFLHNFTNVSPLVILSCWTTAFLLFTHPTCFHQPEILSASLQKDIPADKIKDTAEGVRQFVCVCVCVLLLLLFQSQWSS